MPSDNGNNSSRSSARKTTRISCSISSAASAVCVCGSDLQEAFLEWFYSYREYSKFCLQYLILRPFDNASDEQFKQRLNKLSEWQRLTYRLQFAEQLEEVRWLYIALCEKMNGKAPNAALAPR